MNLRLHPHPQTPPGTPMALSAGCTVTAPGILALRFVLEGDLAAVLLPAAAPPGRAEGLWRATCFECFLGSRAATAYREFNFSPSGQWAAYGFSGYRAEMTPLEDQPAPVLAFAADARRMTLGVELALADMPGDAVAGLSAIIATTEGPIYWALAHPSCKPDFHHRDCFVHDLAAPPDA